MGLQWHGDAYNVVFFKIEQLVIFPKSLKGETIPLS